MTVETISGQLCKGTLEAVDSDGSLLGKGGEGGEGFEGVNIEQVLSISTNRKSSPPTGAVKLRLVDGGLLFVDDPKVDGETITFAKTASGLDSISMQAVRAMVFRESNLIREAVAQPATDQDTVIVTKGTSVARVSGVLESLNPEKLMLNFKGKSRPIKTEKLAAVVIADLGLSPPQGSMATVATIDGSMIRGVLTSYDQNSISLLLTGRQTVTIPVHQFVRIDIDSDSIAYLSSLEPVEVRQRPQFTVARQWQRNRSVEGNPIRLLVGKDSAGSDGSLTTDGLAQVQTFENGIGTSSFSRIVFENTKDFSRFLATVGIDAETEGHGDCEMRVEGDGITLWSQRVRGSDVAVQIDVDISGISQIALVVDPGEQFDLADHADWARARFLKTE
ncbi:NPCBM/NEW2 domain-containing protein [Mariniblastus fucicola]|nr:NPCBM/NEW2 domain-containing protein [Mariniblastus fucicola]